MESISRSRAEDMMDRIRELECDLLHLRGEVGEAREKLEEGGPAGFLRGLSAKLSRAGWAEEARGLEALAGSLDELMTALIEA